VNTPISVSHKLVFETFFSIQDEDSNGQPTQQPASDGLRVLRVQMPIMVPVVSPHPPPITNTQCGLIPSIIDLPAYEHQPSYICNHAPPKPDLNEKGKIVIAKVSRSRQNYIQLPMLDGPCVECAKVSKSAARCIPVWELCACGMEAKGIEGRMKAFALGVTIPGEEPRGERKLEGEEWSRGRTM
jgi:hypothetical protein